jgi:hypothetical protein
MCDLAFYTSAQLVEELTDRSTFAGIVIRSDKEIKSETGGIVDRNWDITYCKLSARQVCELLQDAVEHFKELAATEEANGE